jgi:nicotinate phosphoribosyltransferase
MAQPRQVPPPFHIATPQEIKDGLVTDAYFARSKRILDQKKIDKKVKLEITLKKRFPEGWEWGLFVGLAEALELLRDSSLDLWALPEGSYFKVNEPVMLIESDYRVFSVYETALLGFLCQASGVATKAARCKTAAQGRPVWSFGARRMHPAIAPMIDRAAYIGGCDGVSCIAGAKLIGLDPVGTIPHALIIVLEESATATGFFDQIIEKSVKRVALIDTFGDEKFEALENAELLGENIYAVRLDTPSSRRGDMLEIAREVRWELDIRGYENVKIFISGGLDEDVIPQLNEVADAYGVGTAISNARVCDFSLDIVEIENQGIWEPIAKRGKPSGAKQLYVCDDCGHRHVIYWPRSLAQCPKCLGRWQPRLEKFLEGGKFLKPLPMPGEIREFVLKQLPEKL